MLNFASYSKDGVLYVPSLFPQIELQVLSHEADALVNEEDYQTDQNLRCRFALEPKSGKKLLDALDPVIDLLPSARKIAYSPRLHTILEQVCSDKLCLFKDKFILRPASAPGYPPHQDYISWPFFPKTFLTALVALQPLSHENGSLTFYLGSHQEGLLTPADGDFHAISRAKLDAFEKKTFELDTGDVLIFSGFVVHESRANLTAYPRKALYLSYNALSDGGDQRDAHYRFFHAWLKNRFGEYGRERLYFK